MALEKESPCKVNLLLNILGRRADGFHELETLLHPIGLYDHLTFSRAPRGIELSCSDPALPTDSRNLVYRAAALFLEAARIREGVRLRLEKRIPLAAGLGGGSGDAATALLGLNELFGGPLGPEVLQALAARCGSDVPFFLRSGPAIGTGRGEQIEPLEPFPALAGKAFFLVHPGFGVSTPWAYGQLARFPQALEGRPGRARRLAALLQVGDLKAAVAEFYNSLEAPVLEKYPILALYQEFLRAHGALAALMSGSGSTTFALLDHLAAAQAVAEKVKAKFGPALWTAAVPV